MATGKRYYWLKLNENFFQQKEIKLLRKVAGGDTYTIIYLKMLLKSLKTNGYLFYDGIEDNFIKELALDIDEDVENVAVTVKYLFSKGILTEQTENEFQLLTCKDMVGSKTDYADQKKTQRVKQNQQKLLSNNSVDNDMDNVFSVDNVHTEKREKRKEKREKKKEIEKKEKKKEKSFAQLVVEYTENEELRQALYDFVEMRNKMKGFTRRSLELNLNKLDTLSSSIKDKTQIVNNTVSNGWKGFYSLKTEKGKPIESKYNIDEIEYKDPEF